MTRTLTQDEIDRIELLPEHALWLARGRGMYYTGGVQGSACTRFCLPQSAVVDNVCPDPEQARQTINDGILHFPLYRGSGEERR